MKNLIEKYNNIFDTKRKKALLKLGFWIVFFIVVLSMVGRPPKNIPLVSNNSNKNEVKLSSSSIENFKNMDNYEFTYSIEFIKNNVVKTYNIDGTYYNKKYYFIMDNKNYYIDNDVVYLVNDDNKQLNNVKNVFNSGLFNIMNINILSKDTLSTIIESSTEDSTTSYKDETEVKKYTYVTSDNKKISITSNASGKIINNMLLDLTNYLDIKYDSVKVTCNYKNINNISEFKTNYDSYQIIKEGE